MYRFTYLGMDSHYISVFLNYLYTYSNNHLHRIQVQDCHIHEFVLGMLLHNLLGTHPIRSILPNHHLLLIKSSIVTKFIIRVAFSFQN